MKPDTKGPIKVKRAIVYVAEQYRPFQLPIGVRELRKIKRTGPGPEGVIEQVTSAFTGRGTPVNPGDWVLYPFGVDLKTQEPFNFEEMIVISDLEFQRDYEPAE